jgi:hypothetical protein
VTKPVETAAFRRTVLHIEEFWLQVVPQGLARREV